MGSRLRFAMPPLLLALMLCVVAAPASESVAVVQGAESAPTDTGSLSNPKRTTSNRTGLIASRDAYYERCATVCQLQIDDDLNKCPGVREVRTLRALPRIG